MERQRVSSGTKWESKVGYSRAVRVGDHVHVSGTTATDDQGNPVDSGPHEQAMQALSNVETALEDAGASLDNVVRTRMFVADIDEWEAIGDAHAKYFGDIRPATSMVEVSRLIDADLSVEIEATAILTAGKSVVFTEDERNHAASIRAPSGPLDPEVRSDLRSD